MFFWQGKAVAELKNNKYGVADLIEQLKKNGRESEIEAEVAKVKSQNRDIPNELAFLGGEEMKGLLTKKIKSCEKAQFLLTLMKKF
ncbi:MAG: hypothetical protein IJT73_07775 [Selenomonadaceae bacterium]|nr:hypothetical protein [Selenomonadaceae bacterium]